MQTQSPDRPHAEDVVAPRPETTEAQGTAPRKHQRRWRMLTDRRSQMPIVSFVFGFSALFAALINFLVFELTQEYDSILIGGTLTVASQSFRIYTLVATILMVAAALFTAISMTHRIAGCAVNLQRQMKRIAQGDFDHRVQLREYDTLQGLATSFNDMAYELHERERKEALLLQGCAQRVDKLGPDAVEIANELRRLAAQKARIA